MWTFNRMIGGVIGLAITPFQKTSPWFPLTFFAIVSAIFILLIYRYVSNQKDIHRVKNLIRAYLLEFRLFRDHPRILWSAQGRLLLANARYMGYSLKPMLVIIVPLSLLLVHLDGWFGYRALRPGETAIVSVILSGKAANQLKKFNLEASAGLDIETPPLVIPADREVNWRIRAITPGIHQLKILGPEFDRSKEVTVSSGGLQHIAGEVTSAGITAGLWNPVEEPFSGSSSVLRIHVSYPVRKWTFGTWHMHWLVAFFLLSVIAALVLKKPLRINL